jgi:anti-anti-sigma factor
MPTELVPSDSIADRAHALPPAFDCSWTTGGPDAAWVRLDGELDLATAPELEQTLRESQLQARLVVLDLRGLAFMDTAGAHVIVDASARAREDVCRLVLLRGPPNVDRIFTLTGSSDDVEIIDLDPVESLVEVQRIADEGLA